MAIQMAQKFDRRGQLRRPHDLEQWAMYAALARDTDGAGIVKIGVSSRPYIRVAEINAGSPFPIMAYLWGWVGRRDQAYKAESLIKRQFVERKLRGEWFLFDFAPGSGDKLEFHGQVKRLVKMVTNRDFAWTKGEMDQVRLYKAMERAENRQEMNRRVKPNNWR